MCELHDKPVLSSGISRRGFTAMAAAGAGLSLLPIRARAAGVAIQGVGIMCIDYRVIDPAVAFFDHQLKGSYDLVATAGASLASVSQMFPASVDALWNQVKIAHTLHDIKRVVVLDHRKCGAYQQEFGPRYNEDGGAGELEQHHEIMLRMKTQFAERGFLALGLHLEFFLMTEKAPFTVVPVPV
jgi:hypothetical protein